MLERGEDFFLSAFYDLDTCRTIGMDVGPIPWVHILQYAQVKGLEPDIVEPFIELIRIMDRVYLKRINDKKKEKANVE